MTVAIFRPCNLFFKNKKYFIWKMGPLFKIDPFSTGNGSFLYRDGSFGNGSSFQKMGSVLLQKWIFFSGIWVPLFPGNNLGRGHGHD